MLKQRNKKWNTTTKNNNEIKNEKKNTTMKHNN